VSRQYARANRLSIHRPGTKVVGDADEKIQDALEFTMAKQELFKNPEYDPEFIVNMDKTGIPYFICAKTTRDPIGMQNVIIEITKNSCQRVTG
jgi:hypothetical protein